MDTQKHRCIRGCNASLKKRIFPVHSFEDALIHAIAGDGRHNMSIDIYYFSGTGNSLHVARELQKGLPQARLIPMAALLEKKAVAANAETVGFIFPLYFMTMPAPVRRFCEKLDVSAAKYFFSVVTRMGTLSVAHLSIDRILKKKGKRLYSGFHLAMANNTPTGLKPGKGDARWVETIAPEKISRLDSAVHARLAMIQQTIMSRERYPKTAVVNPFMLLLERLMDVVTRKAIGRIDYFADESCTGCGICERVCPSRTIQAHQGKPVWRHDSPCFYCYACFNFCPTQSILVKNKYTLKNGRYVHPGVTASAIAAQKNDEV